MGLVKISEHMHANVRCASAAFSRSINAQAEHWMRVGMLAELNPSLSYSDICQLLLNTEGNGGMAAGVQVLDAAIAVKAAS
ncbi:ParD-like family protein [Pseudomonas sp. DTU_2021_1001937_2_SI_NGA_ILE_001]|uniref:ParD-like family protein n=1 Tax=Pseudomonas sp. DTU_2021_1001937_2_SI_NGA_ILE_001 TaxID=3077589 RepID=UPI0028FC2AE9|nr:ParD-like family protein [Pseudomonas sp. DTU_2021_1001937_2_SI_NGA_ILE_001]WNW10642.1 ParD-like family protein [Pseudomonas sp. DTU_2021_1001937_2_SI_NGA_ILE_001]